MARKPRQSRREREKHFGSLKCLTELERNDSALARETYESIYEAFADAAGVDRDTWAAAMNRVVGEGIFGVTDEDWVADGGDPEVADLETALDIVERSYRARIPKVQYFDPVYEWEEDADGDALPNVEIDGSEIKNEAFRGYYDIYGRYP